MALSTRISEAFQDAKIKESQVIEKYDISDYTILYKEIDRMNDSLFKISDKYKSEEKTIREKILTVVDDYKSTETVMEINKSLIFKTTNPLFSQDIPNDDDDSNRRAKEIKNLQNDLLNIHKVKDFVKIEKAKRQQIINRYELYKIRLKNLDNSKIDADYEREKEKKQAFIKFIRYVKYSTGIILCVVNFVVLSNLFTPTTWLNIGLKIYNNQYLFRFFLDTMINLNLFNVTDSLTLEKLFKNMQIELDKIKEPEKKEEFICLIIKKVFNISQGKKTQTTEIDGVTDSKEVDIFITNSDILKNFNFYHEDTSDTNKFFNFINAACEKLNIFKKESIPNLQSTWLEIVFNICTSPIGTYSLSQLGLIFNTFAYFERAEKIFNDYSEINPAIIFKEIALKTVKGRSFSIYNKAINESMLKYLLSDNTAKVIGEISFIKDLFGTEVDFEGNKIKQLTEADVRGIFVTLSESFTSIMTNSYVIGYFEKLEKEAVDKNVDDKLLKSMDDRILEIEQNIRKRGKLILEGLSNERVSKLLNRSPKKNDYRFFAFKFMKHFYNYFDELIDNPVLFAYTLTTSISVSKIMEALMQPTILTGIIYTFQNFILSGMYNVYILRVNIWLIQFEPKIKDITSFIISVFFGNDTRINMEINKKRAQIINEITNDFQVLIGELQTIFYDTRVGLHVKNYIEKVNETIFGSIFLMSCKIVYYIIGIPIFQLKLKNIIPKSNLKLVETLKDKNTCIKFFSIIRNKISNIFTIFTKDKDFSLNLFKELKSFFEIDKIMLFNIIPFVANDGYYSYDTTKPFEFKGNIVSFLNENFDERLRRESERPANQRSNLLDTQPKSDEIKDKVFIISSDTKKQEISCLEYNFLSDKVIHSFEVSEWNTLLQKSNFKRDEIFLYYYYSKFIQNEKQKNVNFDVGNIKLKDFDDYLSNIANNLRNNLNSSNGIEYALVNSVRILFEDRYPKNTWSDLIPFYQKKISEEVNLTKEQILNINNVIKDSDNLDNVNISDEVKKKPIHELLIETSVITIPIQTSYGSVPVISDSREFFRITQLINALDSSEKITSLNSKYAELEAKATQENNNIIFSELVDLEYTLNKSLRVVLNNFNVLKKYISEHLPGALARNDYKDEKGVTFKHLGFDYNKFNSKIKDYLQKTNIVIDNDNKTLYNLIYELFDNPDIKTKIIDESEIYYICLDNQILLDISGKINADTGDKVDCKNSQSIKDAVENKEILMKLLFRPEVLIRLSELNPTTQKTLYNVFLSYTQKMVNGITVDEKKEIDGKLSDFKKNITVFSIIDEVIDEQLESYKMNTNIDEFKRNLLKKFKFLLKETVKRGYIDSNLLKYIKQFFMRKEVLLNRYEYINRQNSDIKEIYDNLVKNCKKLSSDGNKEDQITNQNINYYLNRFKEILSRDNFNNTFALSDFSHYNTIPGGNENFGNLFSITSQNEFKVKEQNLVSNTYVLQGIKTELLTTTNILSTTENLCKDILDEKTDEKKDTYINYYIRMREIWYDDQYKLYKFYLLNKSNEIYTEIERKYEITNQNLNSLLQEYERRLNIIYAKYRDVDETTPLILGGNVFSSLFNFSGSKKETSSPSGKTATPPPVTVAERQPQSNKLTTDTSLGQTTSVGVGESQKTEEKQESKVETSEETETGLESKEDTSLSVGFQQGFSGTDNFFNFFANLINMFPPKVTTTHESEISILSDTENSKVVQENKSAIDVCESRHGRWWVQFSEETNTYGVRVQGGLSESEALSCKSNNLTYNLFYNINLLFVNSVNNIVSLLSEKLGLAGSFGCTAIARANPLIGVLCTIILVLSYIAPCTVFIFNFCLSETIKPLVENININEHQIGKIIMLLSWFYSIQSLQQVLFETNHAGAGASQCEWLLEPLFQSINPDFDFAAMEQIPKNIINRINNNEDINYNGIGVIDIGQKENGKNFSDITTILPIISNFLTIEEQEKLKRLRRSEENLNCEDFSIDTNEQEEKLKIIIYSFIEDIIAVPPKTPSLTIKYLSCVMFSDIDTISNWNFNYLFLINSFAHLSYNIFRIRNLLINVISILLQQDNTRDILLHYLFGSSSLEKNTNVGRYMMDNAFINLQFKHTNSETGVFDKKEYNTDLYNEIKYIFGEFFNKFLQVLSSVLSNLTTIITRGSQSQNIDNNDFFLIDNFQSLYNNLENSSNLNEENIFNTLVNPGLESVQNKFETVPTNLIPFIEPQSQDNLQNMLKDNLQNVLNDISNMNNYYQQFKLRDSARDSEVSNQNRQLRSYVDQLVKILELYKKAMEINSSQNQLVRKNINKQPGWFNFPFNNYLYYYGKLNSNEVKSSITSHLIYTCKPGETLVVSSTNTDDDRIEYKTECLKLPKNIIDESKINEYRVQYETDKRNHFTQNDSQKNQTNLANIFVQIPKISKKINLDIEDYNNKMKEIHNNLSEQEYGTYINNMIMLMSSQVKILKESIESRISQNDPEITLTLLEECKIETEKLEKTLKTFTKGNIEFPMDITSNNFTKGLIKQTNDPSYFAYLYLSKLSLIDENSINLSELFKIFSDENINYDSFKKELRKLNTDLVEVLDGDENLTRKIYDNRQKISEMIAYFLTLHKKDSIINEYQSITQSNKMFFHTKEVETNEYFMKEVETNEYFMKEIIGGEEVLEEKTKQKLYYDLYKYGYYLTTPSRSEIQQRIRTLQTKTREEQELGISGVSPAVLLAKISTRYNSINTANYPSNAWTNDLYPIKQNYIVNNGSITKFDNMIPPILIDYVSEDSNLNSFVNKNYEKFTSDKNGKHVIIYVLKMNLALYENTYEKFSKEDFFNTLFESISYKRKQVESLAKSSSGFFTDFLTGYNTNYYDEYFSIPFNINYKEGLGFFDQLIIKDANPLYNTIGKIYNKIGLEFNTQDIVSIFPLSVFQPNLNNIDIKLDENGDIQELMYIPNKIVKIE